MNYYDPLYPLVSNTRQEIQRSIVALEDKLRLVIYSFYIEKINWFWYLDGKELINFKKSSSISLWRLTEDKGSSSSITWYLFICLW